MGWPAGKPRTWAVRCVGCGQERWPYGVEDPAPYTCARCLATPPEERAEKRERASRRGKAGAEAKRVRRSKLQEVQEGPQAEGAAS